MIQKLTREEKRIMRQRNKAYALASVLQGNNPQLGREQALQQAWQTVHSKDKHRPVSGREKALSDRAKAKVTKSIGPSKKAWSIYLAQQGLKVIK